MTEREFAEQIVALGGELYIVGGWVRDKILGRPANDKDYVVCGMNADALRERFSAQPVGQSFPVFLISVGGKTCEVALARTERKAGRGYTGFEAHFSADTTIEEDLYRRDTTMNSIALRLSDMVLIDPFGGQDDIRRGIIRAVSEHFRDDPVRALRAARQRAQLGFSIEADTLGQMRSCLDELKDEPTERVFAETEKALAAPHPELFFTSLDDAGLISVIFGSETSRVMTSRALSALCRAARLSAEPATRFAALLSASGSSEREAENIFRRLGLPRPWRKLVRFVRECPRSPQGEEIVVLLERVRRNAVDPHEADAALRAAHGISLSCLAQYERHLAILTKARRGIVLPPELPPRERAPWLRRRLAEELERRSHTVHGQ